MSFRNLILKAAMGTLLAMAAQAATADSGDLPAPITTRKVAVVDECTLYRMQENGKWSDKLLVICPQNRQATIGSYKDD